MQQRVWLVYLDKMGPRVMPYESEEDATRLFSKKKQSHDKRIVYEEIIQTHKFQIGNYERMIQDGKVPEEHRQWINKLLDTERCALGSAQKEYEKVMKSTGDYNNAQPEKLGGQK